MNKKYISLLLLGLVSFASKGYSSTVVNFVSSADYIAGMPATSPLDLKSKEGFFKLVDAIVEGKAKGHNLVDVYFSMFHAPSEWDKDVINWLEPKINRLPAPFSLLLGYKYCDKDMYAFLKYSSLFRLQTYLDGQSCKDLSIKNGAPISAMMMFYRPQVYKKATGLSVDEGYDYDNMSDFYEGIDKEISKSSSLEGFKLFKEREVNRERAFWIFAHGMKKWGGNVNINDEFVSAEEMKSLKQDIIKQYEGLLSKKQSKQEL